MTLDKSSLPEIIIDDLARGDRLTEEGLARRLGVGRTPLREVLRHLEEEGIICLRQRRGISTRLVPLREVMEIHDLRMLLEGFAARLLASRVTPPLLERLECLARRYREEAGDDLQALRRRRGTDVAFHQLLAAECGNQQLKKILDRCHLLTYSFLASANALDVYRSAGRRYGHETIVAALVRGDPPGAERAARRHIQKGKTDILQKFVGRIYTDFSPAT